MAMKRYHLKNGKRPIFENKSATVAFEDGVMMTAPEVNIEARLR